MGPKWWPAERECRGRRWRQEGEVHHCSLDHVKLQGNDPAETDKVTGIIRGTEAEEPGPWGTEAALLMCDSNHL